LNYTGKNDAVFPIAGPGPHSHAHGHFETISPPAAHAPSDAIIVPAAHLLFNGDFKRSGVDLILSKDDHELLLPDYFKGEKRAALSSPDGAHLTGNIVNALTGHVGYAQAGAADAAKVIGQNELRVVARDTSELILVEVPMRFEPVGVWRGRLG